MMKKYSSLTHLLVAGLLTTSLTFPPSAFSEEEKKNESPAEKIEEAVVSTVNGEKITQQEFDTYLKSLPPTPPGVNIPLSKDIILQELISQKLVLQDAVKQGFDKDILFLTQLELLRKGTLFNFSLQKYLEANPPAEEKLKEEYAQYKPRQHYKVRHILFANQQEASNALQQLQQGMNFPQLALQKSIDPQSRAQGGDLGWLFEEQMLPEVVSTITNLTKGQLASQPVQSQVGWHVLLLEDTREIPPIPFEAARPQLIAAMQQKLIQQYLKELREKAEIK